MFQLPDALLDSFDPPPVGKVTACDSIVRFGPTTLWIGGKGAPSKRAFSSILNAAEEHNVRGALQVPCQDELEFDIYARFPVAEQFLHDALGRGDAHVLFMCAKGQSRSVTLLIAAVMSVKRWTLRETWLLVRKNRPSALPNPKFFSALRKWERVLFPSELESIPSDVLSLHPAVLL